jgi:primosomal protein N' (replication factor Y)
VGERVVRVIPDVAAIDKTFDYVVPERFAADVDVGSMVRIDLHGRRVGGWVEAVDAEPIEGVALRPLSKVSGIGPTAAMLDLARWAAWRWAGAVPSILRTASPARLVRALPTSIAHRRPHVPDSEAADLASEVLTAGGGVVQLPPGADRSGVLLATAALGPVLVVAPTFAQARGAAVRLRRAGVEVAMHPEAWARGAAGASVVGARAAVWAPVGGLAAIVVLDEHDESHKQEQSPAWNARDVAIERARRAGIPCLLVSPCPSLEALEIAHPATLSRTAERAGWPRVDVIDRRDSDPREGLWSPQLVKAVRDVDHRVVCVLNRTGRAKLVACATCGEVAGCERCGAAVAQPESGVLRCGRCGMERPVVCLACGGLRFRALRVGVTRAREELEALLGEPVGEVTATAPASDATTTRVTIGTEAVLHQTGGADVVAFVDFDQELLAPRYRAAEQALALLAHAGRVVGARDRGGRVIVQTRIPRHEALVAALHGDPQVLSTVESARRAELEFPPAVAMAEVSGASAPAFIDALGQPLGIEVLGPTEGRWLLRAPEHRSLCDALAATPRPGGRLRVEVDPLRI